MCQEDSFFWSNLFGVLIMCWISYIFWVKSFLNFAFSLTVVVSTFSMVSSGPEILPSFSCILLVTFALFHLIYFLDFLSAGLSPFVISLLFLFPFLELGWFCSILSPVWMCSPVFLYVLLIVLHHHHEK